MLYVAIYQKEARSFQSFKCTIERRNIRANKIKIDSKPISVKMRVNADPDEIDPDNLDPEAPDYAAECQIDHDEFKYNPVQIRFIHMDQRTSNKKLIGRSLMWHEDDLQTDVSSRHKVFCSLPSPTLFPSDRGAPVRGVQRGPLRRLLGRDALHDGADGADEHGVRVRHLRHRRRHHRARAAARGRRGVHLALDHQVRRILPLPAAPPHLRPRHRTRESLVGPGK